MAIRREAFQRVGPFCEGLRYHQEWEWEQRLLESGGRLVYLPGAWVWHRRDETDLKLISILREALSAGVSQCGDRTPG